MKFKIQILYIIKTVISISIFKNWDLLDLVLQNDKMGLKNLKSFRNQTGFRLTLN